MKAVYALHEDPEAAQRSFDSLKALGLTDREITVMSSTPLEGHEFFERDKRSLVSFVAVAAAVVGCGAGIALTSLTQISWPLVTGGMPIISVWPNLIIIFEITMLSAILATVITLVFTSGLLRRLPAFYDPEVSSGKILIGVAEPQPARVAEIERALGPNGTLKTLD